MDFASSPRAAESSGPAEARFQRVVLTPNFRGGGFAAWRQARIAVIGAGLLGGRLAEEAVLSGTRVSIFDPDVGQTHNQGTQRCRVGIPKAISLVERCDAICPGRVRAYACDVRHAGVRPLLECDAWFDCTDDPDLAWPLTELSNGLVRPLFRCAVDGSGELELGRVLCSNGGAGHACQLCHYSLDDLVQQSRRLPCPDRLDETRPPTIAGGAIGAGTAGLALTLGQRLIAGADREAVWNHEYILDWTNFQLVPLTLQRSARCLSGHNVWDCTETDFAVEQGTLGDLFTLAEHLVAARPVAIAPHLLPLNVQAYCACGTVQDVAGTDRAAAPPCPRCGVAMRWLAETRSELVQIEEARSLGILDTPLAALGIPPGALVAARSLERPPLRMLLA